MSTQPARTIPYYQTGRQQCYRNERSHDAILSCRVINGGFQLAHVHENWLTLLPHEASLQKKLSWYNTCPSHHHHHRSCCFSNYDNDNGHSGDVSDSDGSSGGGGDSGRGGVKL
ncbi:hypothetical protein EDB87DRAFT_1826984 [Lactarius vividus]|nr:hypothetical protein EDB87DRAFT_1826984 [Lactarius vividus]